MVTTHKETRVKGPKAEKVNLKGWRRKGESRRLESNGMSGKVGSHRRLQGGLVDYPDADTVHVRDPYILRRETGRDKYEETRKV